MSIKKPPNSVLSIEDMLKVFGIKRLLRKSQKNSTHSVSKKIQTFERPSDNVIPTEDFSKSILRNFQKKSVQGDHEKLFCLKKTKQTW